MVARRLLLAAALTSSLAAPLHAGVATVSPKRELTPADAVATVRVIRNQLLSGQAAGDDFTSPDGRRYLIRLVYGDAKRNGVWMDLLTGPLDSLESAAHPRLCAHLFSTGLGSTTSARASQADVDTTNIIHWIDNTQVAFLWSDERAIRQIMSVDLTTCKHRFLTHAPADIFSFAHAADGALLFNAHVPPPSSRTEQLWADGFMVTDASDGISILAGYIGEESRLAMMYKNSWFIRSAAGLRPLNIDGNRYDRSNPYSRDVSVGPSGRYAVVWIGAPSMPKDWDQYSNTELRRALTTTDVIRLPVRYAVIDLQTASSRMLWNSPLSLRGQVHWSPSTDTVLLAPTYLPVDVQNPIGLAGNAAAEIDVRTGQYHVLPIDLTDRRLLKARWLSPNEIEMSSTNNLGEDLNTQQFIHVRDSWQLLPAAKTREPSPQTPGAPIRLETRQTLNTPPQIVAVDVRSGQSRLVLDTNPHLLDNFKLGRVERMSGTLPTGQHWIAQLIYPADYRPGERYPLVIQATYGPGFGEEEFSLEGSWGYNGMGLGPADVPAYPGQLLATRNIAVLELQVLHAGQGIRQAEDHQLVYEALSRQLVASGLADEKKIALAGFSNNGYWVEYTLAHSAYPFATAIAADNYDPSYLQSALGNWREMDEDLNGSPAFGVGLEQWLLHAPGFNAERIHTPLLMTCQSGGLSMIIGKWETYSRLRHLNKPAQMYVMPRVDKHPAHTPQNPEQIIAIQEIAIDWFEFWLTGQEDPSPRKREQYARWHRLTTSRAVPNP
jgi:hypothetical protein